MSTARRHKPSLPAGAKLVVTEALPSKALGMATFVVTKGAVSRLLNIPEGATHAMLYTEAQGLRVSEIPIIEPLGGTVPAVQGMLVAASKNAELSSWSDTPLYSDLSAAESAVTVAVASDGMGFTLTKTGTDLTAHYAKDAWVRLRTAAPTTTPIEQWTGKVVSSSYAANVTTVVVDRKIVITGTVTDVRYVLKAGQHVDTRPLWNVLLTNSGGSSGNDATVTVQYFRRSLPPYSGQVTAGS